MAERLWRALLAVRGTLLWSVAGLALLSACATAPPPGLLRRHAELERAEAPGRVGVTVFAAPLSPTADETRLLQLSKSGQSELIRAVASKTATVEGFLAALSAPAAAADLPDRLLDRTRFRRRLVVSAEDREPGEADRIARLRVVLALDTSRALFSRWDRYLTEHGTVEVGEAALRREATAGLELDLGPFGSGVGPEDGRLRAGSATRYEEEAAVSDRYLSTGVLLPDSLVLLQRGALGMDLAGNSVAVVELEAQALPPVDVHRISGLYDGAGRPLPAEAARISVLRLRAPRASSGGIVARLGFDAVTRAVVPGRGESTFSEADDHVRLLHTVGVGPDVTLVPAGELRVSVWELVDETCRRVLHFQRPGSRQGEALYLLDWEEAQRLARWLAATGSDRVGGRLLRLGVSDPLVPADAARLRVRLLPLNWDPGGESSCP